MKTVIHLKKKKNNFLEKKLDAQSVELQYLTDISVWGRPVSVSTCILEHCILKWVAV